MASGLYRIVNKKNNKYYIGSATNLSRRKKNHFDGLRLGKHWNWKLQKDYDELGKVFEFVITKKISTTRLLKEEQKALDKHYDDPLCYNIMRTVSEPPKGRPRGSSTLLKNIKLGQKFGDWTVYDFVMSEGTGRTKVAVKCECGVKSHVPAYDLFKGRSTQCKECSSGKSPTISSFSNRTQRSAIGRGLTYTLDSAFLSESFSEQSYSCALTGAPITPTSAMAVRLDSSGGLTPDNTVLVAENVGSVILNSGMDASTFLGLAQTVTANIQQSGMENPIVDFFNRREQE